MDLEAKLINMPSYFILVGLLLIVVCAFSLTFFLSFNTNILLRLRTNVYILDLQVKGLVFIVLCEFSLTIFIIISHNFPSIDAAAPTTAN